MSERDIHAALAARLTKALPLFLVVFAYLAGGYYYHQIVWGDYYARLSTENSIEERRLVASRGQILTKDGAIVAGNRTAFHVWMKRGMKPDRQKELLHRVCTLTNESFDEVWKRVRSSRTRIFNFHVLALPDINENQYAALEAHRYELGGLTITREERRSYPFGTFMCHALGYMGEIGPAQLGSDLYKSKNAFMGDMVGMRALEKTLDRHLIGEDGEECVETDVVGRVLKVLEEPEPVIPSAGKDVVLTIDSRLQHIVEEVFKAESGAVVAMNPLNGEIKALYSNPGFDPNLFAHGISGRQWKDFNTDPLKPLFNRAIQTQYPPGSIFKIVTALAGLEHGVIKDHTTFSCPGYFYFGGRPFKCWKKEGHGSLSILGAIQNSCNVWFYNVGNLLRIDRLASVGHQLGIGMPTGLPLSGEAPGLMPDEPWKLARFHEKWYPGETISVSIGQGSVQVSPLQIVTLLAVVKNGGKVLTPIIVDSVVDRRTGERTVMERPQVKRTLDIEPKYFGMVLEGMGRVVSVGTARKAQVPGLTIWGKTGTAQAVGKGSLKETSESKIPKEFWDHNWFASGCDVEGNELVMCVFIEHGGKPGGQQRLEFTHDIYQWYYLDKKPEPKVKIVNS